jgi:hypothetical protein
VETELNQLKKKLNTMDIFAAARTQTATGKPMLSTADRENNCLLAVDKTSCWVIQNSRKTLDSE